MNYKSFNLGDWIGHISGVIEDESELDGNEMRDLVEFLTTLNQQPCEDCISREDALMALTGDITDCTIEEFIARLRDKLSKLPSVTPKEKSEYEHDHEVVKAYTDGQTYILDKIKAEIEQEYKVESEHSYGQGLRRALEIIDKYREVSE